VYYIGVTFFLIFFSTASESFFFLLTPRRSSWPRSNGYTNDFGLIFCFPFRLSIAYSHTPSLSLTPFSHLSTPFRLSISLSTHTHIPWPPSYSQWRVVFILNHLRHACQPLYTTMHGSFFQTPKDGIYW